MRIYLLVLMGLGIIGGLRAQEVPPPQAEPDTADENRIKILNTNLLSFEKREEESVKKLVGNVQIQQDSTLFFCDSAYHFETQNRLEAYNRVRVEMADSVQLRGEQLEYDANTQVAEVFEEITLTDGQVTLNTDHLTYFRAERYGTYDGGGTLRDTSNVLTSKKGYYYPGEKMAYFRDSVKLVNPEYTLETDTLGYNAETRVATFLAPTRIVSKDGGEIITSQGTYDTRSNSVNLTSRSTVKDSAYIITADTLDYDNAADVGIAKGNIVLEQADSTLKLLGDYGLFNRATDESVIYGEPMAIQVLDTDTLYMYADTLLSVSDSLEGRSFRAYPEVFFFMNELQGKSDSLIYQYDDSIMVMYEDPIIWSNESQLTGDTIYIQMKNSQADSMWVGKNSFLVSREDTLGYNQVKGKEMRAKFRENQLVRLHVIGNSESIYFSKNEAGEYDGMNQALAQEMIIYLKDNQANKILFLANPEGKFYPLYEVLFKDFFLDDMQWRILERPRKPYLNAVGLPYTRQPMFFTTEREANNYLYFQARENTSPDEPESPAAELLEESVEQE